jgi:chromosome segregation ATPase
MLRQRRVNISHEFTTGLAGVINQFTQQQSAALEEQKAKYHKYIKRLRRDLAEESAVVAQQLSHIDAQTKEIKDLQGSKEQMASLLSDIEVKLSASEDRARRLEEKYRACKTHLNSAIQEQQDLYTRSKKQWAEALEQVRTMEESQRAGAETAVRKAEVLREQMMEKVRQAIAQHRSEAVECK